MLFGRPWPAGAPRLLAPSLLGILSLGTAADLEAQAGVDTTWAEVDSVRLAEHPEGTEVTISASGPLKWSMRDLGGGELIVRLLDCRPGAELPMLRPDQGLVESVDVGAFGTAEHPETRVTIRTRGETKHRVAVGEGSVSVLLISRQPVEPPAPEPASPEPEQPPAIGAPSGDHATASRPPPPADATPVLEPPTFLTEVPEPPRIAAEASEMSEPESPEPVSQPPGTDAGNPEQPPPVAGAGAGADDRGYQAGEASRYRIGAGDVLAIDVFGLDELDRKVRVQHDGSISLPLLDAFDIAGLDLGAAERLIAGMLRERRLVREPQVSIRVEELVSRAVNVQGAVVHPGVYQLIGSKTLLELIGEAGGLREDSGTRVLVLRTERGEEHKMDLDLEALIAGEDRSLNVRLIPGDAIMVPFSRRLTVYVTGAVEQPGPVSFQSSEGITVLQAIIAAGGPTSRANMKNVHVLRKSPGGGQERIKVNIKKIQSGKMDDVVLQRSDTVVVGEWFF